MTTVEFDIELEDLMLRAYAYMKSIFGKSVDKKADYGWVAKEALDRLFKEAGIAPSWSHENWPKGSKYHAIETESAGPWHVVKVGNKDDNSRI